jgi:uncharacterized protein
VEQAICADAELSAKDLNLNALFLQSRDRLSGEPRDNLIEAQRNWVSKRNQCHDPGMVTCLAQSYDARIRELEAAGHN